MLYLHPRTNHICLQLSSGNKHQLIRKGYTVERATLATCLGGRLFLAKVGRRTAKADASKELSRQRRKLEVLQHHGHGQPQSGPLEPKDSRHLPFPKRSQTSPPSASLSLGPQSSLSRQLFILLPRQPSKKPGHRCESAAPLLALLAGPRHPLHPSSLQRGHTGRTWRRNPAAQRRVREGWHFPPRS